MDRYVGKKLDGRYDIKELIGIGGMANVYRCYDTIDDREVAIKILKDEFLNNDEFIRRFKNESKAIAVLSHPNIVKVYDVSFGDMIQYIVMEYIDGITLKEYISQQGILSWKETVHLLSQILVALSHAHSKGIVHRDVKPQNMMLMSDGTIKVTDFGIARFSNNTKTMTEQAIGSVHYIAPEQAKGDITDGRTDIYSVGVMMYEMLTGKLPFDGDNAVSVALMHLQVTPDMPSSLNPDIPEGLEEIVLKAMQKQPSDRYQSAQDMLSDIERFRLNPSVRFEYKYLTDKHSSRYVDAINRARSGRNEELSNSAKIKDDDSIRHSYTFPIIVGLLIAVFLTFAVCVPLGIIRSNQGKEAADVDVPNLVGMSYGELIASGKYSFNFVVEEKFVEDQPLDTILDMIPAPGSKKIKENGTITLTVNRVPGDGKVIPPTVLNMTEANARALLVQTGFSNDKITTVSITDSNSNPGIVKNISPPVGTKASRTASITLYVVTDNKSKLVYIPFVVGESEKNAKSALEDKGFTVKVTPAESDKPKGTVVSQSPLGGSVAQGSSVEIFVSNGEPVNTVTIYVDMPEYVTHSIALTVKYGDKTSQVEIPGNTSEVPIKITFSGTITVQVLLDNQLYREYKVNFTKMTYSQTSANDYIDHATSETTVSVSQSHTGGQ